MTKPDQPPPIVINTTPLGYIGTWMHEARGGEGNPCPICGAAAREVCRKPPDRGVDNFKAASRGAFLLLDPDLRERVLNIHGEFHIRDGAKNPDGSRGTIRMTPDELRDLLAYLLVERD